MIRKILYLGFAVAVVVCATGLGCSSGKPELTLVNLDRTVTIAVAPALNQSGSRKFDPIRLADLMVSELTQIPGVRTIPVNRVLAQLESEGKSRIESPEHALQVMDRIGADGIIVFAVTEFDPYAPPTLGISAQLYGYGSVSNAGFDPVEISRRPAPYEEGGRYLQPRAEFQKVFSGSDEDLIREIKRYTKARNADGNPFGWQKFVVSQDHFMRFCCYFTAQELIQQEITQVAVENDRKNEVEQR